MPFLYSEDGQMVVSLQLRYCNILQERISAEDSVAIVRSVVYMLHNNWKPRGCPLLLVRN